MTNPNKINPSDSTDYDPDIDLGELFRVLWGRKIAIVIVTAIFTAGSLMIAVNLTDYYRSSTILKIEELDSKGMQVQSRGNAAIARMAGITMGGGDVDKALLALETIRSRVFLKHLMSFEGVTPALGAAIAFDKENQTMIYDTSAYNPETKTWIGDSPDSPGSPPTSQKLLRNYKVNVVQAWHDMASGTRYVHLSVTHVSPIFAKRLMDLVIHEYNEGERKRVIAESEASLKFLENELTKTSFLELKHSINQLMQNQLEIQMAARIKEDYILRAIEPPFQPEVKYWPKKWLVVLLGALAGGFLSVAWIVVFNFFIPDYISEK